MTGPGRAGYVAVPANQVSFDNAVGAFQRRMTSTPRSNKKKRRSRSAVAFGQKVPQHPDQPRASAIKRGGSQDGVRLPLVLRDYPVPSHKTPRRPLTLPETPVVLRNQPNTAATAHNIPSKPPAPPKPKPQERISRPTRRRDPLRQIQQVPAWVERLSQPKTYPVRASAERRVSANSSVDAVRNRSANDVVRRQLTF